MARPSPRAPPVRGSVGERLRRPRTVARGEYSRGSAAAPARDAPPHVLVPTTDVARAGRTIETHGPYQHGEGFKTVNSGAALQLFDANTPPKATQTALGPGQQGTFASVRAVCAHEPWQSPHVSAGGGVGEVRRAQQVVAPPISVYPPV